MNRIADNVIPIKTSLEGFFEAWLDTTNLLLHHLSAKERKIMAAYLKKHFELSQKVNDEAILSRILMDETTKVQIMEECNIKRSHLQVINAHFKKEGLMVDGRINPKLIPAISKESLEKGEFRLLVVFKYEGDQSNQTSIS
jgi:hypothetical protein